MNRRTFCSFLTAIPFLKIKKEPINCHVAAMHKTNYCRIWIDDSPNSIGGYVIYPRMLGRKEISKLYRAKP